MKPNCTRCGDARRVESRGGCWVCTIHGRIPLQIHTARVGTNDRDALAITWLQNMQHRKARTGRDLFQPDGKPVPDTMGHRGVGRAFAPSAGLLWPLIQQRRMGTLTDADWVAYVADYHEEMRQSYKRHRKAWDTVASWARVVLVCYCTDPERCHRTVLARLLVKSAGGVYLGELAPVVKKREGQQIGMF